MVHADEEVEDFVAIASSLVVNIGTLSPPWVAAMARAATRATALVGRGCSTRSAPAPRRIARAPRSI